MAIKDNHFVSCRYDLYAGSGDERNLVEQATAESPMQYMHGIGMMLPEFEKQLAELNAGDKFDFELTPEQSYGERREDLLLELDREVFTNDEGEFDSENVYEGNVLPMMTSDGQRIQGMVIEVTDAKIKMDFNHPMAGMHLHFEGEILEEHLASREEHERIQAMLQPQGGCGCGCHDEGSEGGCCSSGGCSGGCH